ncbi:nitroreductase [bacterium]|nr:nitroreductase [bacterium]
MNLTEAVRQRRSIRQFLDKPVPESLIKEILTDALWAPSWGNTQPWEIVVVSGDVLATFKRENISALDTGQAFSPDVTIPEVWPASLKKRYKDVGKSVLGSLEIAREDLEGRGKYYRQMFSFFDAPVLLMFLVDRDVSLEYAMLDIGSIMQTVCLLAQDKGLGTCILAASINYGKIAHKLLQVPDNKRFVIGTSLGWPDTEAQVNQFARERGELDEFVKWVK